MSPRDDSDDERKHEQKKRNPRRFFSLDSIKSNGSSRRSSSDQETTRNFRSPLNPNVQESDNEANFIGGDHLGQVTFVEEPTSDISPTTSSSPAGRSVRLERATPPSISSRSSTPTSDNAPSVPLSATRRWDNVRQHFLPGRVRPSSPLQKQTPSQASLPRPSASSSTPRPSGLSRLGFRNVLEPTRDVSDDTRNFGKEVLKACAAARYAEVSRLTKEKDGQLSTISLSGTTTTVLTGRKSDYFPQSIALLTSTSGSTTAPSLKPLHKVLKSGLSPETGQTSLPHESHVLGTLLCPFLTPSKYPIAKQEEEKATAVEVFEILKTWAPIDEVSCYPSVMKNCVN
jgi:hypothetical protein